MHLGPPELLMLLVVAVLFFGPRSLQAIGRGLAEGIASFRDNFRGGPGGPSHPIPSNDSRLLNRKRSASR